MEEAKEDANKKDNLLNLTNDEKNENDLLDYCNFSKDELENIWICIKNKSNNYKDIQLEYSNEEENANYYTLYATKGKICEKFCFYKEPIILNLDEIIYKIYTLEQCLYIISNFDLKEYSISVNGITIKDKKLDHETIKNINIKKIKPEINEIEFAKYIIREKHNLSLIETVINIDKKFLSLYYEEICFDSDKNESKVDLVLEKNRIEFINKINDFLVSNDIFYLILGTDGIGKTITLLYYTSLLINDYKNLYLNLKLFLKYEENKIKLKDIFFDEIKRIFLTDKNTKNDILSSKTKYLNLINRIDDSNIKVDGIQYFWELLFSFILIFNKLIRGKIFIVLDQYKVDKIDKNFKNLNKLCNMLITGNLNNSFKLMILISINNYDTKEIFLENLNEISFIPFSINNILPSPNYISNIEEYHDIIDNNQHNNKDNYELEDIEKFLNEKHEEFQKNFQNKMKEESKNISLLPIQIISKLDLNSKFRNITKKEYMNEIVSCEKLLNSNINKNIRNCLEIFGYSLKYYSLLLYDIHNTKKIDNEKDDEFLKRVIKIFFSKMTNKILLNLDKYYLSLYGNCYDYSDKKANDLKKLNDSIYEEKIYPLRDMNELLKLFPIKYLNIYIVGIDSTSIPLDKIDISKYGFFFDYSNNFIRKTIYKYFLKEYYFYYKSINLGGSGFGAVFEDSVNKKLSSPSINNEIKQRNVFSLVGTKTIKYIEKLRKKEDLPFFEFYDLKLLNVLIDGVDNNKVNKENFDIIKYDVYLNQLSKGGRSFDAGILKKSLLTKEATHDLILFQDTKQKIMELKDKNQYYSDAQKTKKFLEGLYENLIIDKIYLIFVLPYGINVSETINKLNINRLYYLFYYPEEKYFFKNNNIIDDFRVPEAELDFNKDDFDLLQALSNIKTSKNILNKSIRSYLGKKRIYNNKFINIYNKIAEDNNFNCITVIIPNNIKNKIIMAFNKDNIFNEDKIINFIPGVNCDFKDMERIFKNQRIMFIFSYKKLIYLYYVNYYIFDDDFCVNKVNFNPTIKGKPIKPNDNLKSFLEIKNYPLFCFGFNIYKNHIFD